MDKYHINPETGNPGLCSAKIKCPFGGDDVHYFSKEAAQKAFEEATKTEALKAWKKKKVNHEPDEDTADTGYGFHGGTASSSPKSSPAPFTGHGGFHGYVAPAPAPAPKPKAKPAPSYGHGSAGRGGHGGYGSGFGGHGF